ncbi:MAG: DUF4175 domain-containing protein [bacterium]|nr:DUF4175 domain-containing protein [bacterium]
MTESKPELVRLTVALLSAWIVALLAATAAWFVLGRATLSPTMRALWYVLVAVALVRAVYRSYAAYRSTRPRE